MPAIIQFARRSNFLRQFRPEFAVENLDLVLEPFDQLFLDRHDFSGF